MTEQEQQAIKGLLAVLVAASSNSIDKRVRLHTEGQRPYASHTIHVDILKKLVTP